MKRNLEPAGRRHERGGVAIEAAIMLPLILVFIGLPSIFLAFYFRQYSAAQKAVHDAALYLSTAPRVEFTTTGPDGNFAALTLARKIVEKEMTGLVPDGAPVDPAIYCIYRLGAATPTKPCTTTLFKDNNHTLIRFDVSVNFTYINPITGSESVLLISPSASVRYLGN